MTAGIFQPQTKGSTYHAQRWKTNKRLPPGDTDTAVTAAVFLTSRMKWNTAKLSELCGERYRVLEYEVEWFAVYVYASASELPLQ
jgi:hypothetical protein